jgi:Ankyrin repeats (many copies)
LVKMLLDKQSDINIQNFDGYTPLHYACQQGHTHSVEMFRVVQPIVENCCVSTGDLYVFAVLHTEPVTEVGFVVNAIVGDGEDAPKAPDQAEDEIGFQSGFNSDNSSS